MKDLILRPRISEKAYGMSQAEDIKTYVFDVPKEANKHTIARAVAVQFEVTVTDVRVLNMKGKAKQSYRKGQRPITGSRSDVKKAYVTLQSGEALPLFAAEEQEEAAAVEKAAKAAKVAKKADKKADKPAKAAKETK